MPDFLSVLVRPRETMRRILDQQRYRWWPLVVLAIAVTMVRDPANFRLTKVPADIPIAVIVICVALVGILAGMAAFYGLAWVAYFVGRQFDGKATPVEIRAGGAWGLAPLIASALYQLPLKLWASTNLKAIDTMACSTVALLLFLEVVTLLWYLYVASNCVAEAEGFSAWAGLGTVCLTWLSPLVIIVAAALSLK